MPRTIPHEGAIELRSVTKRYNKEAVVDNVSVTINAGEFFSLLGPSGSGKTTTLMMLAGFAEVDGGDIFVDRTNIVGVRPQHRGFGMVFQNYAIFPHLNVFENVAFPLRARRVPAAELKKRVMSALELVRLERFADRYARQLSGGQQQRVAIARAIVFRPPVVLMDEPLGALDKNLRYQMQLEIKEIQQQLGMTVVYVTHDQEEAMNMSDRIAIMNSGRIEQVGPPREVYETPANTFAGRFLGEANLLEGTIEEVRDGRVRLRTAAGTAFQARAGNGVQNAQRAALFVRPERVRIGRPAHDEVERNHVAGRLGRTSFLGNIHRHMVELEPGTEMIVDVQNGQAGPGAEPGQSVELSWPVSDSIALPV
ncbi:ABC transporter ATP-binding protein [Geminicoccaceae bacterium 1502E]|nr:ABC transporter ATP-binding protein [Geminicoccaceae bacterium 1502E]